MLEEPNVRVIEHQCEFSDEIEATEEQRGDSELQNCDCDRPFLSLCGSVGGLPEQGDADEHSTDDGYNSRKNERDPEKDHVR